MLQIQWAAFGSANRRQGERLPSIFHCFSIPASAMTRAQRVTSAVMRVAELVGRAWQRLEAEIEKARPSSGSCSTLRVAVLSERDYVGRRLGRLRRSRSR